MNEIKKIVVIGPESTGKSTLSEALAKELNTSWAKEAAREYLEQMAKHGKEYQEEDMQAIAILQVLEEEEAIQTANKYVVCDTDLHVIKVWSEAKYGRCDKWVLEQIAERKCDLYILTNIDMPWQDDPLREHPNPEDRSYFYNIYKDIVQQSGVPWVEASGTHEERLKTALQAIHTHLK